MASTTDHFIYEEMTAEQLREVWPDLRRYLVDAPTSILIESLLKQRGSKDKADLAQRSSDRKAKAELHQTMRMEAASCR